MATTDPPGAPLRHTWAVVGIVAGVVATCVACSQGSEPAAPAASTTVGSVGAVPGSGVAGTTTVSTPSSTPGTGPGTTIRGPGGTLVAGACPDDTWITYVPSLGSGAAGEAVQLTGLRAYADVNQDAAVAIGIANFDVPPGDVSRIGAPSLSGDQVFVGLRLTASGTRELEATDYVEADGNSPPFEFNTHSLYTSRGRVVSGGVEVVEPIVRLTKIDKDVVCGAVSTAEVTGVFRARVV